MIEQTPIKKIIFWSSFPLLAVPLFELFAVSSVGTVGFLFFQDLVLISGFACPFFLLFTPFWIFSSSKRRIGIKILLGTFICSAACCLGLEASHLIRMEAFQRLALRSLPLIDAINKFSEMRGTAPKSLEDLVPQFLEMVPNTGIGVYPKYKYRTGSDVELFEGNPWVLIVHTPKGFVNFDQFMYFPNQNYPDTGYGGWLRRIHDWAYVHE